MTNPQPFEGRSAEMKKDSPWLASEDIMGLEIEVEIEKVFRHQDVEFDAGRKEKTVYSIAFVGKKKQLVLNSTNRKTLVAKFGVNVKDWAGKKATLYVDQNVRLMGKKVCGIRIK
jgi:hypothetical protein